MKYTVTIETQHAGGHVRVGVSCPAAETIAITRGTRGVVVTLDITARGRIRAPMAALAVYTGTTPAADMGTAIVFVHPGRDGRVAAVRTALTATCTYRRRYADECGDAACASARQLTVSVARTDSRARLTDIPVTAAAPRTGVVAPQYARLSRFFGTRVTATTLSVAPGTPPSAVSAVIDTVLWAGYAPPLPRVVAPKDWDMLRAVSTAWQSAKAAASLFVRKVLGGSATCPAVDALIGLFGLTVYHLAFRYLYDEYTLVRHGSAQSADTLAVADVHTGIERITRIGDCEDMVSGTIEVFRALDRIASTSLAGLMAAYTPARAIVILEIPGFRAAYHDTIALVPRTGDPVFLDTAMLPSYAAVAALLAPDSEIGHEHKPPCTCAAVVRAYARITVLGKHSVVDATRAYTGTDAVTPQTVVYPAATYASVPPGRMRTWFDAVASAQAHDYTLWRAPDGYITDGTRLVKVVQLATITPSASNVVIAQPRHSKFIPLHGCAAALTVRPSPADVDTFTPRGAAGGTDTDADADGLGAPTVAAAAAALDTCTPEPGDTQWWKRAATMTEDDGLVHIAWTNRR